MRGIIFVAGISICLACSCHNKPAKILGKHPSASNKIWLGNWDRHEWQNGGELTISKLDNDSIVFHIEANGGAALGELDGKAHVAGDSAVFTNIDSDHNCRMIFRLNKNRTAISVNSTDCNYHVGLGAYFEGRYDHLKGKAATQGDDTTQTLVSLDILNKEEDNTFRKLVGKYYRTYVNNTQQTEDDLKDQDKLNAKITASFVNQMRTQMEYIIMIDSSKHIWTAVIDDGKVRYFTNSDLFKDHIPQTIDNWRESFKDDPIIYHGK